MSESNGKRRVAVITGSRAEFGLLIPVMEAIRDHPEMELLVIAAGSHLVQPALTFRDVKARFAVADSVPMQTAGRTGRAADVEALGKGVVRFGRSFDLLAPDWVVVLGDRVEAFAAASAASVGGFALAHIHGGDVAEGIADEAMRHAITKLAHLHLAATPISGGRITRMGEKPEHVHVVGSPAIDGLDRIEPMSDDDLAAEFGAGFDPTTVLLHHPSGLTEHDERACIEALLLAVDEASTRDVLCLAPNFDPGRDAILERVRSFCDASEAGRPAGSTRRFVFREHLPRALFLGLLRRLSQKHASSTPCVLVGNSSAGLIEAAAMKVPVLNVGPRQDGRERPANVADVAADALASLPDALSALLDRQIDDLADDRHPYGDGHAAQRIATLLAGVDPRDRALLRKRLAY